MSSENQTYQVISPQQMCQFWQMVQDGLINSGVFQAFLNNVYAFTLPQGVYYQLSKSQQKAAEIMGPYFIGLNLVISSLRYKGVAISLTEEELEKYSLIPFSETTLTEAATAKWRGKRAMLWWAPPERYELHLKRLLKIFGTDEQYPPCFYKDTWWKEEAYAEEILTPGWHLNLVELPDETKGRNLTDQLSFKQEYESLCKPVEIAFLGLVNYLLYREHLFTGFYTRTETSLPLNYTISIGEFETHGLCLSKTWSSLSSRDTPVGLLLARRFDNLPTP